MNTTQPQVNTDGKQTKRQKALEYMRMYVGLFPTQEIDQDWCYQISIGENPQTLKHMIAIFGSTEAITAHYGSNLKFVIDGITE